MDGALKNQTVTAVQTVFLSPLVDQLTCFGQVSVLAMLQHLFTSYGMIGKIDLRENAVKMMEPYEPPEPLARMIENWKRAEILHTQEGKLPTR